MIPRPHISSFAGDDARSFLNTSGDAYYIVVRIPIVSFMRKIVLVIS